MLRSFFLVFILLAGPCVAMDNDQYTDAPEGIKQWFKAQKSPSGVPCCDVADGHRTTWRTGKDGGYEAMINGAFVTVPDTAVIHNSFNPTGEAVVWYTEWQGKVWIRCFVPGTDS